MLTGPRLSPATMKNSKVFDAFDGLDSGEALAFVSEHDPKRC